MTFDNLFGRAFLTAAMVATLSACDSKDNWPDVDSKAPEGSLNELNVRTEPGETVRFTGTFTDADGIASIRLVCHEIYLDKTIDLIEIKGEPQKSYDLDFAWALKAGELFDAFDVEITVTDVGGRQTVHNVRVTLDADHTAPVFTAAPDKEITVLIKPTTNFNLKFTVTDNIGLDYIIVNIDGIDGFPMRIEGEGKKTLEFSQPLAVPSEEAQYNVTIEAFDLAAQNDEVRSTLITSVVNVSPLPDFDKMYLADVATADELNSDLFGVPMLIDHTGPYTYTARYYNEKAGTQICFIPQKTDFSPICFGPDKTDATKLGNEPDEVGRLTLDKAGVYYKIDFNTKTCDYTLSTYSVDEAVDPVMHMHYGQDDLNTWWGTEDIWWQEWYIGPGTDPGNVAHMEQDSKNPHIFRINKWTPADWMFEEDGGTKGWTIQNWHSHGWWNFQAWRVDNSEDPEKIMYYGNYMAATEHYESNRDYFDYKYGDVPDFNLDSWSSEDYRKNFVPDNWIRVPLSPTGVYTLVFDAHLERIKVIPAQ